MNRRIILAILIVVSIFSILSTAANNEPPTVSITQKPNYRTKDRDVAFKWSGSDDSTSQSELVYSYKLEGLQEQWSNWSYDTTISYSDLEPGRYTFKVKVRDESDLVSFPVTHSFTVKELTPSTERVIDFGYGNAWPATIGPNGKLYFVYEDNLEVRKRSGEKKWSFDLPSDSSSKPAIAPDGTLYIASGSFLFSISSSGEKKWSFKTDKKWTTNPAIGSDETIYIADNANFFAINPNGTKKWRYRAGKNCSEPAIGISGVIFFTAGGRLYAVDSDGSKIWSSYRGESSSPVIGPHGTIYVAGNSTLSAIDKTGKEIWSVKLDDNGGGVNFSPVVGPDGNIYIGTSIAAHFFGDVYIGEGATLYSIDSEGEIEWTYSEEDAYRVYSPTIGGDGTIYVGFGYSLSGHNEGKFFGLTEDGEELWQISVGSPHVSSTIGESNHLYVVQGGNCRIMSLNSSRPSPWPMFRHDLRRTARVNPSFFQGPFDGSDSNS